MKRLRIGLFPFPFLPHFLPFSRLGRELKKLGHETFLVGYSGGIDNLRLSPIFERNFNSGFQELLELAEPKCSPSIWWNTSLMAKDSKWLSNDFNLDLDFLFIDATFRFLPYWAESKKLEYREFFCGVPSDPVLNFPSDCYCSENDSILSRAYKALKLELSRSSFEKQRMKSEMHLIRELCHRQNIPLPNRRMGHFFLSPSPKGAVTPSLTELDLKGNRPDICQIGPLLPNKKDTDWDSSWQPFVGTDENSPLIIVSFGTTGIESSADNDWFSIICQSIIEHFQSHFIVITNNVPSHKDPSIAKNPQVFISSWVPLWEMLNYYKNAVLVSHGGMNSFKDAVCSQTPIVAIPQRYDQFAVAARIDQGEFGISLLNRRPSKMHVISAVSRVINNPKYRQNCSRVIDALTRLDSLLELKKLLPN